MKSRIKGRILAFILAFAMILEPISTHLIAYASEIHEQMPDGAIDAESEESPVEDEKENGTDASDAETPSDSNVEGAEDANGEDGDLPENGSTSDNSEQPDSSDIPDSTVDTGKDDESHPSDDKISDVKEELPEENPSDEELPEGNPSDEVVPEEDADEEEMELPSELTYAVEDDGIQVKVSGEIDALNGAVALKVERLPEEREAEYREVITDSLPEMDKGAVEGADSSIERILKDSVYAYDIALFNRNGEQIEPSGAVSVEFSSEKIKSSLSDEPDAELYVFHNIDTMVDESDASAELTSEESAPAEETGDIPEEEEEPAPTEKELVPADTSDIPVVYESLQGLTPEIAEDGTVTVTTDGFSEYVLVLTGKTSQKETSFGDGEYLELDKYLEQTGEINNQKSYDLYLENAYFRDGVPVTIKQYAPLGIHSLLITDQSSSMAGAPVDAYNTAIEAYVDRLVEINKSRIESAKNGEYTDIDPNSDTIEQDMAEHLFYISGCIGFNQFVRVKQYNGNELWDVAPLTSEEATALKTALHVKNDLADYKAGKDNTDMADGTKTYLALDRAYEFLNAHEHYGKCYNHDGSTKTVRSDQVLLITDGGPNRIQNAEQVTVDKAQKIKNLGIKFFGVFEQYGSTDGLQAALDAQDITKVSYDDDSGAVTLGMCSSDCPKGGTIGNGTFSPNPDPDNTFGKYTNFHNSLTDLTAIMTNVATSQNALSNTSVKGYASDTAYIKDTITDPFEITDLSQVAVFAVPRIPKNLDENNIPVGVETDPSSPDYGIVSDFVWAEQSYEVDGVPETGWIDITDQVSLNVSGNTVTVTGWDYEKNAVTNYDKDLSGTWPKDSAMVYKTGDYGYKVIVVIPINAKITFGGNRIETNNSETSAFYPSTPVGYTEGDASYMPEWKNNTALNPEGRDFIESYPVPIVDLNINYKVASDFINIYAPQTAETRNLVTDKNDSLWYVDDLYNSAKTDYDNANSKYKSAANAFQQSPDDEELEIAFREAYAEYLKARQQLNQCESYVPDGINNAYVDISYTLKDPDGETIATLYIPHGKAYVEDADGNGNIDWIPAGGSDGLIKKSGTYTITCTVSPVDTVKAPGGHVSTEADSANIRNTIPYDSQEYSSTGSSASGSQTAKTVTEETSAYLYQLKITTADTRLVPRQTLDFNQGNEDLSTTENPHILKYEWVCTDGSTKSVKENEPGETGLLQIGDGGVIITNQIPDQARTDGLVETVMGTDAAGERDGIYVPVGVTLSRKIGNLNKSVSLQDQTTQILTYMTDDDQIFGTGYSSVIWNHGCDIVTDPDCNDSEYVDAQKYGTVADGTATGAIRYLIHVQDNPNPNIKKETTTPAISKGADIKWNVTLSNDNETTNERHNASDFSMVDVLPYNGDGRIDPNTNNEGSKFEGELQYKKIRLNLSGSPTSLRKLKDGTAALYYTADTNVRTADEAQILGTNTEGNISWTKLNLSLEGETAEVNVPAAAVAVKFTTRLLWNEKIKVDMTANVQVASIQKAGDRYHNQAFVYNGNGGKASEVVVTTVPSPYLSGTIWEDTDSNGIMDAGEPRLEDILVTLYKKYNPNNGGTPDREINGVKLTYAYTSEYDKFAPILTGPDGTFIFDDIMDGTYYVVADHIQDQYQVTEKQAGRDDANLAELDSEAESDFAENTDKNLDNTAWIKEVEISYDSIPNQNIGLNLIRGTVTVGKTVDEIYWPSSMSDEEREDYQLIFHFGLKNVDTGRTYTKSVRLTKQNYMEKNGQPQVYCIFEDIPLGTYILSEIEQSQYAVDSMNSENTGVSYNSGDKTATIKITPQEHEFAINVKNKLVKDPPGGDENGVDNWINVRIPVSLEMKYVGPDPISSKSLTAYQFSQADFADMIVTYDDGTQISLQDGSLNFDQIALSPSVVTNDMNSGKDKITVSGYYSEKGRTVKDSFRVAVDLKPIHKFQLNFDANGSTFDDGSNRNTVLFGYDENKGTNFVTKGIYKDSANGLLNGRGGDYRYVGWNTRNDGTGVNYDGLTALNALGQDNNVSVLTLYARWTTTVTFDAAGGTLAGGTYAAEQALTGQASGSIAYNVNQKIATGLSATKPNYAFVTWNTNPDGSGTNLVDYGAITKPVTFYAIYYRTDFGCIRGTQSFTAPVSGYYTVQLWGAQGQGDMGSANPAGGGYATGKIFLTAGQTIYVEVGEGGTSSSSYSAYNGGGMSRGKEANYAAGGGGATHIATVPGQLYGFGTAANAENYVYAVAGGSGGLSDYSPAGGSGGGTSGGYGGGRNGGRPGTQTSGAAFGRGESCGRSQSAAGGGGWYGGYKANTNGTGSGGGGGSGHLGRMLVDGSMANNVFGPGGHHGYVRFTLTSIQNTP